MKKSFIILSMLLMGISINLSAQYTSIKLTAAKDTIHLGDGGSGITTKVLTFNYEAKTEAAFAQASMEVHHINPFDLPEIYVNGKLAAANVLRREEDCALGELARALQITFGVQQAERDALE